MYIRKKILFLLPLLFSFNEQKVNKQTQKESNSTFFAANVHRNKNYISQVVRTSQFSWNKKMRKPKKNSTKNKIDV